MQKHRNAHRETFTASYAKAHGLTYTCKHVHSCMLPHALTLITPRQAEEILLLLAVLVAFQDLSSKLGFYLQILPGKNLPVDSLTSTRKLSSLWTLGPVLTSERRNLKNPEPTAGTNHGVSTSGSPL